MYVEFTMQSLGIEICDDCKKEIPKGENINMVVYENKEPYGRIDDKCLELLKKKCNSQKHLSRCCGGGAIIR